MNDYLILYERLQLITNKFLELRSKGLTGIDVTISITGNEMLVVKVTSIYKGECFSLSRQITPSLIYNGDLEALDGVIEEMRKHIIDIATGKMG